MSPERWGGVFKPGILLEKMGGLVVLGIFIERGNVLLSKYNALQLFCFGGDNIYIYMWPYIYICIYI